MKNIIHPYIIINNEEDEDASAYPLYPDAEHICNRRKKTEDLVGPTMREPHTLLKRFQIARISKDSHNDDIFQRGPFFSTV
jgi:hypothetical protein